MVEIKQMTLDEFLTLPESVMPTEYIDNEVIMSPAPPPRHQVVLRLLVFHVNSLASGGELIFAPADVLLGNHILQPDLFWIRADGDCVIQKNLWQGAPDLVVEVLSPSTARFDRGRKYEIYEAAGVREYWLVDPDAEFVEVYVRDGQKFARLGLYDSDDTFTSSLLGAVTVRPMFED